MFFITVLLIVAGLAMVFSASAIMAQERYHSPYTFAGKQALWALIGLAALLLLSRIDYTIYKSPRFIYPALSVTIVLLVSVFLMPGSHNTHRWIRFGDFFTFQPSEIAKPVLVLFLAWFLSTRLDKMLDWKNTLTRAILIPVVFVILIVRQPDLGTALVLAGVTAMMLFLAGMNWKYLAGVVCATLPFLAVLLWVPWRRARVMVFLHPNCDAKELPAASYHVCQSLIAVGTGGITGRGYMEGVQKLFSCPKPTLTSSSPTLLRRWASSEPSPSCCSSRPSPCAACASPSTCRTPLAASPPSASPWPWFCKPSSTSA